MDIPPYELTTRQMDGQFIARLLTLSQSQITLPSPHPNASRVTKFELNYLKIRLAAWKSFESENQAPSLEESGLSELSENQASSLETF